VTDLTASEVSVFAKREVVEADVQAQLEAFDRSTSSTERLNDLQIALTLVDDFLGENMQNGKIGKLGWSSLTASDGSALPGAGFDDPGVFVLDTGTATTNGSAKLSHGAKANLIGVPIFMCEMRVRLSELTHASPTSCWIGLHNGAIGAEPASGMFFRYLPGNETWDAVCSNGGVRLALATSCLADGQFHRFRITSDGSGIIRFYVDVAPQQTGVPVATITDDPLTDPFGTAEYLPNLAMYSPAFSISKTGGAGVPSSLAVDYFALRYEHAR
jgi:hypothetical protein